MQLSFFGCQLLLLMVSSVGYIARSEQSITRFSLTVSLVLPVLSFFLSFFSFWYTECERSVIILITRKRRRRQWSSRRWWTERTRSSTSSTWPTIDNENMEKFHSTRDGDAEREREKYVEVEKYDLHIPWHLCCGWPCRRRRPGRASPERLCRQKQWEERREETPNWPGRPSSISFSSQSLASEPVDLTHWTQSSSSSSCSARKLIAITILIKTIEYPVIFPVFSPLCSYGAAELDWLVRSCVTRLTTHSIFDFHLLIFFSSYGIFFVFTCRFFCCCCCCSVGPSNIKTSFS